MTVVKAPNPTQQKELVLMAATATEETITVEGADRVRFTTSEAPKTGKRLANWLRRQGERLRQGASWLWNAAKRGGSATGRGAKTAGGAAAGAAKSAGGWAWSGVKSVGHALYWSGTTVGGWIGKSARFLGRSVLTFARVIPMFLLRILGTIVRVASWVFMTIMSAFSLVGLAIAVVIIVVVLLIAYLVEKYRKNVHKHAKAASRGEYRDDDGDSRVQNWVNERVNRLVNDDVVPGDVVPDLVWSEATDKPTEEPVAEEGPTVTTTVEETPEGGKVTTTVLDVEDLQPGQTASAQVDATKMKVTKPAPEAPKAKKQYTPWPIPELMKVDPNTFDTGHGPWAIDTASPVVNWPPDPQGKGEEWLAAYFSCEYCTNGGVGLMMDPPKNVDLHGLEHATLEELAKHKLPPEQVKLHFLDVDYKDPLTGGITPGRPQLAEQTDEQRFRNVSYWKGRALALETYRGYLAANPKTALSNTKRRWGVHNKNLRDSYSHRDLHQNSTHRGYVFMCAWLADREKLMGIPETWVDPLEEARLRDKAPVNA